LILDYIKNYKLFNVISSILFILFILFIININNIFHSNDNFYYTKISDASGLKVNQDVDILGYNIGKLNSFKLNSDYKIILELKINSHIKLSKDSYLFIGMSSLFSSQKTISIKTGINDVYIANKGFLYNSQIGLDINKILDFLSYYISSKIK